MLPSRLPVPTPPPRRRPLVDEGDDEVTKTRPDESGVCRIGTRARRESSSARVPASIAPRYTRLGTIGSGGMGTVYLARATGSAGFSRLVAIKRLHAHLSAERELVAMLVDEARLMSSIHHANVVSTVDLVAEDGGFSLVLEYVDGASVGVLMRESTNRGERVPRSIAIALITGVLRGLGAVHDARSAEGRPLGIVHRDVSPANVLVGIDGVPRIIDFGVAKAVGRVGRTRPGEVRGKFSYMSPEQLHGRLVTRQADVYATGVMLWELLTGTRLFKHDDERIVCARVLRGDIVPPSHVDPSISPALDAVVMKALASDLAERYHSAQDLLEALAPFEHASDDEVGRWVRDFAAEELAKRAALVSPSEAMPCIALDDLVVEAKRTGRRAVRPRHATTRRPRMTVPPAVSAPPVSPAVPSLPSGVVFLLAVAIVVFGIGLAIGKVRDRQAAATAPTFDPLPMPIAVAPAMEPREGQIGALQVNARTVFMRKADRR